MEKSKRIVGYARVSTETQDITRQIEMIKDCCRVRNYNLIKIIQEKISGAQRYSEDLTLEEFTQRTRVTHEKAVKLAKDINDIPDDSRETILSNIKYLNEKYVKIEDNRLIVDKNLANIDIQNFKITKQIYKNVVTLTDEQKRIGYGVHIKTIDVESIAEELEMNPQAKVSFEELFKEYAQIKEQPFEISCDFPHYKLQAIVAKNPLIKEAYDKLGSAGVARLNYHQTNIRRELVKRLDTSTENKIVKMINSCLPYNIAIPNSAIKERLQGIYDTLGIKRTAKATDLNY